MAFRAKYHGSCPHWSCEDEIEPGDLVDFFQDNLMHARCVAELDPAPAEDFDEDGEPLVAPAPRPVGSCEECWMELPNCFCDPES